MKINVTGDEFTDHADEIEVDKALAALTGEGGEAFAILAEAEMTYIQTSGWPEVGYDLEYQEGAIERHHRCTKEPLALNEVSRAFKQYLRGDSSYKSELPWEHDEILASYANSGPRLNLSGWLALLLVLGALAVAFWYFL